MFDHDLVRWKRDRPIRMATVGLCLLFIICALMPENDNLHISKSGKFVVMSAAAFSFWGLALVAVVRVVCGKGYFQLAVMLLTFPIIYTFAMMTDNTLRWALVSVFILDMLFSALVPPGLLMQLLWGMWRQLRQITAE